MHPIIPSNQISVALALVKPSDLIHAFRAHNEAKDSYEHTGKFDLIPLDARKRKETGSFLSRKEPGSFLYESMMMSASR